MLVVRWFKIRRHERGLWFRDREFHGVLRPGRHWFLDLLVRVRVDIVSVRNVWLRHPDLDVIARSGALGNEAEDGRFEAALGPGLHVLWKVFHAVKVETVVVNLEDAREVRLERKDLHVILNSPRAEDVLDTFRVEEGHVGLFFRDGQFVSRLSPGTHAFWKNVGKVKVFHIDSRESMLDISGQEIMTADKVTLRLNASTGRVSSRSGPLSVRGSSTRSWPRRTRWPGSSRAFSRTARPPSASRSSRSGSGT